MVSDRIPCPRLRRKHFKVAFQSCLYQRSHNKCYSGSPQPFAGVSGKRSVTSNACLIITSSPPAAISSSLVGDNLGNSQKKASSNNQLATSILTNDVTPTTMASSQPSLHLECHAMSGVCTGNSLSMVTTCPSTRAAVNHVSASSCSKAATTAKPKRKNHIIIMIFIFSQETYYRCQA